MVSTIYQNGEDALDNEANVVISLPTFLISTGLFTSLTFRTQKVSIPAYNIATSQIYFMGYALDVWKPEDSTEKEVEVSIRVDKYWGVYDILLNWAKQLVNQEEGTYFAYGDSSFAHLTGTLAVEQQNGSGDSLSSGWTFENVWPKQINAISFDTSNDGDPIRVDVTFAYSRCYRGS